MNQLMLETLYQQQGMRQLHDLRTLVRAQTRLPGRKTILLFAEGLVIPPESPELLDAIISEANRANISFYTVDARGLSVVSNVRLAEATSDAISGAEPDSAPQVFETDLQANARHRLSASAALHGQQRRSQRFFRTRYQATFTVARAIPK